MVHDASVSPTLQLSQAAPAVAAPQHSVFEEVLRLAQEGAEASSLGDASAALARLSIKELEEVRRMHNPPVVVRRTLEATFLLLNASKVELVPPAWTRVQKLMSSSTFLPRMQAYDTAALRDAQSLTAFVAAEYFAPASKRAELQRLTRSSSVLCGDSSPVRGSLRSTVTAGVAITAGFGNQPAGRKSVRSRTESTSTGKGGAVMRRNWTSTLVGDLSPKAEEQLTFQRVSRASQAVGALFRWCTAALAEALNPDGEAAQARSEALRQAQRDAEGDLGEDRSSRRGSSASRPTTTDSSPSSRRGTARFEAEQQRRSRQQPRQPLQQVQQPQQRHTLHLPLQQVQQQHQYQQAEEDSLSPLRRTSVQPPQSQREQAPLTLPLLRPASPELRPATAPGVAALAAAAAPRAASGHSAVRPEQRAATPSSGGRSRTSSSGEGSPSALGRAAGGAGLAASATAPAGLEKVRSPSSPQSGPAQLEPSEEDRLETGRAGEASPSAGRRKVWPWQEARELESGEASPSWASRQGTRLSSMAATGGEASPSRSPKATTATGFMAGDGGGGGFVGMERKPDRHFEVHVEFVHGSGRLLDEGEAALQTVAATMCMRASLRVELVSSPAWIENSATAESRLKTVADFLANEGLPSSVSQEQRTVGNDKEPGVTCQIQLDGDPQLRDFFLGVKDVWGADPTRNIADWLEDNFQMCKY